MKRNKRRQETQPNTTIKKREDGFLVVWCVGLIVAQEAQIK